MPWRMILGTTGSFETSAPAAAQSNMRPGLARWISAALRGRSVSVDRRPCVTPVKYAMSITYRTDRRPDPTPIHRLVGGVPFGAAMEPTLARPFYLRPMRKAQFQRDRS